MQKKLNNPSVPVPVCNFKRYPVLVIKDDWVDADEMEDDWGGADDAPPIAVEAGGVRFEPDESEEGFVDAWRVTDGKTTMTINAIKLEDGAYAATIWAWTGLWWHQRPGREGRLIRLTEEMRKQGRRPGFQKIRNKQRYTHMDRAFTAVVVEANGEVHWTLAKSDFNILWPDYVGFDEMPSAVREKFAGAVKPILSRAQIGEDSVKRFLDCVLRIPS